MSKFEKSVYEAVEKIPKGFVASYSDVAMMAGSKNAHRAVGNILHNNPLPGIIPCHRVVHSDGTLAAAFAFGGEGRQRKLLEEEGVVFLKNGKVNMAQCSVKKIKNHQPPNPQFRG